MNYSSLQWPLVGIWWLSRHIRYLIWGGVARLFGPLKFSKIGKRVKFNGPVRVEKPFSDISLDDGTMVGCGCYFLATSSAFIRIGKNVGINDNCYITANYGIIIEDEVRIGENVSIRDYDHNFEHLDVPIRLQGLKGAKIHIGKGSWIGRGVMITQGVLIGEGCIIGANAVVTKDLPPWTIAAGVPARVIRKRGEKVS